ncbi:MAG: metallophosphoesterase, partial [bacterium]
MEFVSTGVFALAIACVVLFENSQAKTTPPKVLFSFVVTGCNRVDKNDVDLTKNPSTANTAQLERTFDEIAGLNPRPDFLFFAGDMVFGYASDSTSLAGELNAWKNLWEASSAKKAGIELIPIPGNHETQNAVKVSTAYAESAWLASMGKYLGRGGNGPTVHSPESDSLTTDQSKLTYSFDFKNTHFVVTSTDAAGRDWHVPANWIANDVTQAHQKSTTHHIFLIGH